MRRRDSSAPRDVTCSVLPAQVARWLHASRKHHGLAPLESIWIVGVSYGAAIGSAAAGLFDEFSGYVAVSYPASYLWYCCNLQGETYLGHARTPKPKLFLWGDVDVFAGKKVMETVFASMPHPKDYNAVPTLDATLGHYFRSKDHLEFLTKNTLNWLKHHAPTLPPRPPSCSTPPSARVLRRASCAALCFSSARKVHTG